MDVFGSGGGGRVFLLLDMTREVERIVFDFSEMFFLLECATFGKPSPKRLCEMNQNTTVFESTIFFITKIKNVGTSDFVSLGFMICNFVDLESSKLISYYVYLTDRCILLKIFQMQRMFSKLLE